MNKKLLIIALSLVCMGASSGELTIINPSSKSSPATVLATVFKDAVDTPTKWYQSDSCQDAVRKFNATDDAVMAYNSSMDFAGKNKGVDCSLTPGDISDVVFISKEYFDICRNKGSTKDYGENKISVGLASMYATKGNESDMKGKNVNASVIPYPGSKDIVNAIMNNDIDYGWIGHSVALKFKDSIDCVYSTNPSSPQYLGKVDKSSFPEFHINMVIYTNTTDSDKRESLKRAAESEKFTTFLTNANIETVAVTTQAISSIKTFVKDMITVWGRNGEL